MLDEGARDEFQGLLDVSTNEKGQTLLTLFHLTGFEKRRRQTSESFGRDRQRVPAAQEKTK